MKTRLNKNIKVIAAIAILVILVVLAVKTVWVGINLCIYSNAVVESSWNASEYAAIRAEADAVYENVSAARDKFYNSSDAYIRWLSNLSNNLIRLPLSALIVISPYLFFNIVCKYNRRKRIARR